MSSFSAVVTKKLNSSHKHIGTGLSKIAILCDLNCPTFYGGIQEHTSTHKQTVHTTDFGGSGLIPRT